MESSEYVGYEGPREGKGVGLVAAKAVQRGRWREFRRTLLIAAALVAVQLPLRFVVKGKLDSVHDIALVVPGRLSLIVDVLFVIAYVFVAYRAFGLIRSCRADAWALALNKTGLALVVSGALLDLVEDGRLWMLMGDGDYGLTVSFDELFGGSADGDGFTVVMRAFVGLGLLAQAISFFGYHKAGEGTSPGLTAVPGPGSGGAVICCSGGGIRSAAFSLGGLQALATTDDLYQNARAVVGVSGGGYVAAASHVLRWNPVDKAADATTAEWPGPEETGAPFSLSSPELTWLRRHTRYVLNGIRIATQGGLSLAFGIAVNLLLITAVLGGTAWMLAWLMLASGRLTDWEGTSISGEFGGDWSWLACVWVLPAAGVALFLWEKVLDRFSTIPFKARSVVRGLTSYLLLGGLVLTALVLGVPAAVAGLGEYAATSDSMWAGLLHQLGFVPTGVCRDAAEVADACGVSNEDNVMGSSAVTVPSVSVATVVASILAVLASAKGAAADGTQTAAGFKGLLSKIWAKIKDPIVPWFALAAVVLAAVIVLLRWVAALVANPSLLQKWEYAQGVALALLVVKLITDANRTSLHHFFRDRISYAFLVRRNQQGGVQPVPYRRPLRFSEATPPRGAGPELVACAVANVSDEEVVPSRRGCIPFVFDHRQIGLTDKLLPEGAAQRMSATYEFAADARYRDATIPAAVAMSAAAFSPLAGRENVRLGPYRAVLALGNARLGVWLPNPLWVDELGLVRRLVRLERWDEAVRIASVLPVPEYNRLSARIRAGLEHPDQRDTRGAKFAMLGEFGREIFKKPGITRLAKEAFGKASVYDRFLYVTDGGHYDNLGLIEALRRKPKRIYVLDASNDKEDTFRTLGRAIATARMDLDCEVIMNPRTMLRLAETRAGAAWCEGIYRYAGPDGAWGRIFLAKAILLDDLSWDIEAYKLDHIDFPRTSTGNQLYSEFDFEAYRALGEAAVRKLLASPEHAAALAEEQAAQA